MVNRHDITALRAGLRLAACAAVLFGCGQALAFYPIGGWDSFGTQRYAKWALSDFDNNNDGAITAGEGREVQIEGGPAGFTAAEIETIRRSFRTWQQVPTTYAAFKLRGIFQDPLLPSSSLDSFDTVSSIYMQVTELDDTGEDVIPDPDDVILQDVAFPVLGVTLILYNIDDVTVEISGQIATIPAGTIIDSDIIINASATRAITTTTPIVDLEGVMTHELGHFLGLDHPALNNLRPEVGGLSLLESPALAYTAGDGLQRLIGVTPTMFPFSFLVQDEQSRRIDGARDLAPDDISGISFLYPRGSQAGFFDVAQEARTETRVATGLPSVPIVGGHIVAWADQDNNPDTPRIPMFGTISGLYEQTADPQLEGRFLLQSLWKQVEVFGSDDKYIPSYTFTLSPLNGLQPDVNESFIRQQPAGMLPTDIDSMHDASTSTDTREIADYFPNSFASQVFEATENILDVSNHDAGTAMYWDYEANELLSVADGRNLASILPNNRPMFGDPNDGCPLFLTEIPGDGGTGTGTGTAGSLVTGSNKLRAFRDNILLQTTLGSALVNTYYHAAAPISAFLKRHPWAFETFRAVKIGAYWTMDHAALLALLPVLAFGAAALLRRRRAWTLAAAGAALWLLLASIATAQIAYQPPTDFIAGATDIVAGKVVATEARWAKRGRIYTDVTVQLEATAKGTLDKANSTVTFSVIGGTKDGLIMKATEFPTFNPGEELVLYLREYAGSKFTIYGGNLGKVPVIGGSDGSKSVAAAPEITKAIAEKKAKEAGAKAASSPTDEVIVSLEDYLAYIRDVVAQQEAEQK